MMKLLKIFIGTLLLISLVSCDDIEYKVPEHFNCVLLTSELSCINTDTKEEILIPLEEGKGFICFPPKDYNIIYKFGNTIMKENIQFSKCRSKRCIKRIIENHNRRQ